VRALIVIFKQHNFVLRITFEDEVKANQGFNEFTQALTSGMGHPFWRNNTTVVALDDVAAVTLV
jgi:hypothetical protein